VNTPSVVLIRITSPKLTNALGFYPPNGFTFRQRGDMPNKDKPIVDRHAPKNGVGWLMKDIEGKVCRFSNDTPTAHAQWVEVETRPLKGGGQPVIRRLLRHNALSAWETMQKSGGWKRCPPKW
jgi:hypothetical protein